MQTAEPKCHEEAASDRADEAPVISSTKAISLTLDFRDWDHFLPQISHGHRSPRRATQLLPLDIIFTVWSKWQMG